MTLNPSAAFETKNELSYKTPMYVAKFQTILGYDRRYRVFATNGTYPIVVTVQEYRYNSGTGQYTWMNPDGWTPSQWVGYTAVFTSTDGQETSKLIDASTSDTLEFYSSLDMDIVVQFTEIRLDFYETFCTYKPEPSSFVPEPLPYISYISGGGYSIAPDEGSTSSATIKIEMQDNNGYVTNMIHNATGRLQKKTCIVKAGYVGLQDYQMLTVFTGEVTDYEYNDDGTWTFSISDAIRDLNKNIFRNAGEDETSSGGADNRNIVTGNPIDLLLSLCISNTGDGTKGPYDNLPQGYGLNMSVSKVDVAGFQQIRDDYFPTTAVTFNFIMTDRISAIDFFVDQIFRPLNMYPIVKGNGQFSARVYRPTIPPYSPVEITENDIVGIPTYDGNLTDLINEVQFSYNFDDGDYTDIVVYSDATSINERGVGDRTLEIESEGIKDTYMDADDFILRSANRIFNRYAAPPIKLSVAILFKYLLVESGDIILVSNKFLPNLDSGTFAFENVPMEVVKRTVDWKNGKVKLELLQTGYDKGDYAAISPEMIVETGTNSTQFDAYDVKDYVAGFVVSVWRRVKDVDKSQHQDWYHLEKVADDVTIVSVTGNTVVTSDIGTVYEADMRIVFNDDPPTLTDYQQRWGRIDAGYLISP